MAIANNLKLEEIDAPQETLDAAWQEELRNRINEIRFCGLRCQIRSSSLYVGKL